MELQLDIQTEEKFSLLGMQAVSHDDGIILKRGSTRVMLNGTHVPMILNLLLEADSQAGFSVHKIKADLPSEHWELLDDVVAALLERRLVVMLEADSKPVRTESPEDIFYWEFKTSAEQVRARISRVSIAVFGINNLSLQLLGALKACGFGAAYLVDHPALRGLDVADNTAPDAVSFEDWTEQDLYEESGFFVVCSDFGGLETMREWNDFCVTENKNFMPVVIQDNISYIGPIIVPGQTPCFECLWERQNSNLADPHTERATDNLAFFGQHANGTLAPIIGAAANLAASELLKFFSQVLPGESVGKLIELHQLEPAIHKRKFVKSPFCRVCSTTRFHSSSATDKNVFMPGNDTEEHVHASS